MPVPVVAGIAAAIGWLNSQPDWFKYFVFLAVLATDALLIEGLTGSGAIGYIITFVFQFVFGLGSNFIIYSWQLLILAAFLPVVFWLLRN